MVAYRQVYKRKPAGEWHVVGLMFEKKPNVEDLEHIAYGWLFTPHPYDIERGKISHYEVRAGKAGQSFETSELITLKKKGITV